MGQVLELASPSAVNDAWNSYTEYAKALASDPSKLTDRAFHEEFQRRYMRWAKLFQHSERSK